MATKTSKIYSLPALTKSEISLVNGGCLSTIIYYFLQIKFLAFNKAGQLISDMQKESQKGCNC